MSESFDVAVIGAGYVGIPHAATFAEAGCSVLVVDVVPELVEQLNRGESHVEDVSSERLAPLVSRIGWRISRVVPGHVVDSSTTSCPFRSTCAMLRAEASTIERSGSRWRESGVGTAMTIASHSATSA